MRTCVMYPKTKIFALLE
uniref:Uncharacterized protein n=1 Tax=Rhizophora mucronata TaxID=61149 RepID=A0A2P2QD84_RHIMU